MKHFWRFVAGLAIALITVICAAIGSTIYHVASKHPDVAFPIAIAGVALVAIYILGYASTDW
jgi:predicted benzoate:H+ symporter BenE